MKIKKKIIFVITEFGGFNLFLSELCFYLLENNNDITIITTNNKIINTADKFNYQSSELNFKYINIPRGYNLFKYFVASFKINKIIKDIKPDLINAHLTTGIFATIFLKKPNYRILGTFHGLGYVQLRGFKKLLFYLIENICFYRLDKILVLNEIDYNSIPFFFKNKAYKYKCLGLGCDLEIYNNSKISSIEKNLLISKFDISNKFVLTYTGRFVDFKGFHLVAKAFLNLDKNYKNKFALILIGGKDPLHNSGLNKNEETAFFENNNVKFISFTNDIKTYLSITNLFLFPSRREGVPISITEALAMGIPVITLNTRGCNELVINDFNGIVLDDNISEDLIVKNIYFNILNMFSNQNLLYKYSNNALSLRDNLSRINFIEETNNLIIQNF